MQDHPGAPGTARKGIARTIVSATCGGVAAPKAPGPDHPLATTARLPGQGRPSAVPPAPDQDRSRARHTMAPGHGRPLAASSGAARHDRPCATLRAPGVDVPSATTARAPGQHRPRAVPSAPDHARSRARHQKAPGHDRPSVAPSGAAEHDRPRATPRAPGHDVPLATVAGAPGYGRPCAAPSVPVSDRSRPAPMAQPGHALASAGTSVPITTAPLPARVSRLHQERLASITATPNNRTHPRSLQDTTDNRSPYLHVRTSKHSDRSSRHPRLPRSHRHSAKHRLAFPPPLQMLERGPGGEAQDTTHPPLTAPTAARRPPLTAAGVHPATQAPRRPSPTTATGVSRQPPSRAPPLVIAAQAAIHVPTPQRGDHRGAGACQARPRHPPLELAPGEG